MKKEKSKCEKCNKDAVIVEDEKYYCALHYCYKHKIPKLSIQINQRRKRHERTTTNTNI